MENSIILKIYQLPQTVFTLKEMSLSFPDIDYPNLKNRINYFVRTGKLKALRKGVYSKPEYEPLELANKLYTPSYISLETVLFREGLIFQYDETIHVVSYVSRDVKVDNKLFAYRRVPRYLLTEKKGLIDTGIYFIAGKERAFLDSVFLYKDYHIDNLLPLDWDATFDLINIYASKALVMRVNKYYKYFKEVYVK